MSDESAKADRPKTIQVEMDPKTLEALGALMPAVTLWARSQGDPDPTPGDVVNMAVLVLHAQVFERAADLLTMIKIGESPTTH